MTKTKAKPYPASLLELMATKSANLMKAQTFAEMGMADTAQPIWAVAASQEKRIAPLLDALGRDLEAAASRISAASCYQKSGELSRAANLYQGALAFSPSSCVAKRLQPILKPFERLRLPQSLRRGELGGDLASAE